MWMLMGSGAGAPRRKRPNGGQTERLAHQNATAPALSPSTVPSKRRTPFTGRLRGNLPLRLIPAFPPLKRYVGGTCLNGNETVTPGFHSRKLRFGKVRDWEKVRRWAQFCTAGRACYSARMLASRM